MKSLKLLLGFSMMFIACTKSNITIQSQSDSGNTYNISMTGTWILYQYQPTNSNTIIAKSDTLVFYTNNNYTYNNQNAKYYLSNFNTYSNYRLIIYNTALGNLTGLIPDNFESAKEINGAIFYPYGSPGGSSYLLWLKKL
jgi:hypothetical protein